MANAAALGWKQAAADVVSGKISGFLTARTDCEDANSTKSRLAKEEAKNAMREFANASIRCNRVVQKLRFLNNNYKKRGFSG